MADAIITYTHERLFFDFLLCDISLPLQDLFHLTGLFVVNPTCSANLHLCSMCVLIHIFPSLKFFIFSAKHTSKAYMLHHYTLICLYSHMRLYMTFLDSNFDDLGALVHNNFSTVFWEWKFIHSPYFITTLWIFSYVLWTYGMTILHPSHLLLLSLWVNFVIVKVLLHSWLNHCLKSH